MIKIELKNLEKNLKVKFERNSSSVGLDTASRSGWCKITTDEKYAYLDYGYIKVDSKDVYFKLDELIKIFSLLIKSWNCQIVIEDVFFGRNVNTLKLLTRIGTICYTIARLEKQKTQFILATSARSKLGLKHTGKKEEVHKQFASLVNLEIKDIDIIDAIILALVGLIKNEQLDI